MSSFTLLMDNNKFLRITTPNVNLFQGDNYVDSFQVLVPILYGDIDLRNFTTTLEYVDSFQNAYVDILVADEDIYKENYIRYTLPITTTITKCAGIVKAKLSMNYVDKEALIQYSLHTSEIEFMIHPQSDYYKFSDESLNKIDKLIGELETKIDYISETVANTPNDLGFDEEGTLHLTVSTVPIGNGVDVAVPGTEDDQDSSHDGIINADEIYETITL